MVLTCSKCSRANPTRRRLLLLRRLRPLRPVRQPRPRRRRLPAVQQPLRLPHRPDRPQLRRAGPGLPGRVGRRPRPAPQGLPGELPRRPGPHRPGPAASEAARFPDPDRGLDQFLAKLPTSVLAEPKLSVEPQEVNLGVLPAGADRELDLHLKNQGMRLLYGTVTGPTSTGSSLGEAPAATEKLFQFTHELKIPVRVKGDRLRASKNPLEAGSSTSSPTAASSRSPSAPRCPSSRSPRGVLGGAAARARWPRRPWPSPRSRPRCSRAATSPTGTSPTAGSTPCRGRRRPAWAPCSSSSRRWA